MRTGALLGAWLILIAAAPALAELQVAVSPDRVAPVALGDARVWNAYVTVSVLRDGRPAEGAAVELRGASGPVASGRTDAAGNALLPVLSREPFSLEVWVDGADSGRRVEAAGGGGGTAASPGSSGPTAPGPALPAGWLPAGAVVGIGALFLVFGLRQRRKKRFKRGD